MARVKLSPKVPASLRAVGPPGGGSPTISAMVELASRRHKNAVQGYGPTLDTAGTAKGAAPEEPTGPDREWCRPLLPQASALPGTPARSRAAQGADR
jgi:hypothetical protein